MSLTSCGSRSLPATSSVLTSSHPDEELTKPTTMDRLEGAGWGQPLIQFAGYALLARARAEVGGVEGRHGGCVCNVFRCLFQVLVVDALHHLASPVGDGVGRDCESEVVQSLEQLGALNEVLSSAFQRPLLLYSPKISQREQASGSAPSPRRPKSLRPQLETRDATTDAVDALLGEPKAEVQHQVEEVAAGL